MESLALAVNSAVLKYLTPLLLDRPDGSVRRWVHDFVLVRRRSPSLAFRAGVASRDVDLGGAVKGRAFFPAACAAATPPPAELGLAMGAAAATRVPLVVYFHGGGFVYLSPFGWIYDRFCRQLAATSSAVVLSVDYRLAPEHPFPAAYDDGTAALQWLQRGGPDVDPFIAKYADLGKVIVMGDSAGANIAHHVVMRECAGGATKAAAASPLRILCQILLCPFFGGVQRLPSELEHADGDILSLPVADGLWQRFLPSGATRDHWAANPLSLEHPDLGVLPPTLVVVAGKDLLHDRGVAYAEVLKIKGVDAEVLDFEGSVHTFMLLTFLKEHAVCHELLKQYLQRKRDEELEPARPPPPPPPPPPSLSPQGESEGGGDGIGVGSNAGGGDTSDAGGGGGGVTFGAALAVLLAARLVSARHNLVHDCDEVFNYWEPLHNLLHGAGLQTWEYSSQYALRSNLYLLLHCLVAWPVSLVAGAGANKVATFYVLRGALGAASAATEAALVAAVGRVTSPRVAAYSLVLLAFTSGCFIASTALLLLHVLDNLGHRRNAHWKASSSSCGGRGWRPSGVAIRGAGSGAHCLSRFLSSGLLASHCFRCSSHRSNSDQYFYGRWTCSVFNLVWYNVAGGGDSALYGTEGALFYLRNGLNNFNLALPLALALPIVAIWAHEQGYLRLLVAVMPLYLWLAFMSLQAHKEERFLFVIYPLICVAAAAMIDALPEFVNSLQGRHATGGSALHTIAKWMRPVLLSTILVLSYCRTAALLSYYNAPMLVYKHLPSASDSVNSDLTVCVGSEWHRFPLSFFLPSAQHRIAFLDDGFRGLLPFPFDQSAGGTAAAPVYINNRNKASPHQFVRTSPSLLCFMPTIDIKVDHTCTPNAEGDLGQAPLSHHLAIGWDEALCDFLIELDLEQADVNLRGRNSTNWQVLYEHPFLDNEHSSPLSRALYLPWWSEQRNRYGYYRLLKRTGQS
eukprot:SM000008S22149  [mRNA]  locus=s8:31301:38281:- [translate_table: standard]